MEKYKVTVDGINMGLHPKKESLKKLNILKGITVQTVKETEAERQIRLERQRRERRANRQLKEAQARAQPSLIDGLPTIEYYHGKSS